jgi:murein DD-endopeptidase MepM/ murein hydrolase activator NlpD
MGFVTLGHAGSTTVRIPAGLVELIGFHEASHPGSKAINAAASGLPTMVLSSRGRGTPAQSAADIVVPPGEPLRAPVTGTVVAARQYVLYCKHQDSLVYIEPDGLPGWQVRLFHVQGDLPAVGSRVIAGETVVASGGANPLPFESQIDEFTAEPSWPHTHLEVVDTSVPDDRPPGGGC